MALRIHLPPISFSILIVSILNDAGFRLNLLTLPQTPPFRGAGGQVFSALMQQFKFLSVFIPIGITKLITENYEKL